MLDRFNRMLDDWERKSSRAHWITALAKTVLTFGVTAGTLAATANASEAAYCNCSMRSCSECGWVTSTSTWYCTDTTNCCTVAYNWDCFSDSSETRAWLGHCNGVKYERYCA